MYEDTWLHYRLPGVGEITKRKLEDFKNLDDIKRYMREIDAKTEKLFDGITNSGIEEKVNKFTSSHKVLNIQLNVGSIMIVYEE